MARSKSKALAVIDVGPKDAITDAMIRAALIETSGKITLAAALLKTSYGVVRRRIDRSSELQDTLREVEESKLDQLEHTVERAAIRDGDVGAASFLLRTQGKARGYGDELTVKTEAASARRALDAVMSRLSDDALAEVLAALEAEEG